MKFSAKRYLILLAGTGCFGGSAAMKADAGSFGVDGRTAFDFARKMKFDAHLFGVGAGIEFDVREIEREAVRHFEKDGVVQIFLGVFQNAVVFACLRVSRQSPAVPPLEVFLWKNFAIVKKAQF